MRSQSDYYDIQDQIMEQERQAMNRERFYDPTLTPKNQTEEYWEGCEVVNEDGTRIKS